MKHLLLKIEKKKEETEWKEKESSFKNEKTDNWNQAMRNFPGWTKENDKILNRKIHI